MNEPRVFYRPAVTAALEAMGYAPAEVIRSGYGCLAIVFPLGDVMAWSARVVHYLHSYLDRASADEWAALFIEMTTGAKKNGTVELFPGWTLTP